MKTSIVHFFQSAVTLFYIKVFKDKSRPFYHILPGPESEQTNSEKSALSDKDLTDETENT